MALIETLTSLKSSGKGELSLEGCDVDVRGFIVETKLVLPSQNVPGETHI